MNSRSWNYYEVLDISPQASQDKIFDAYKKARKTFSLSSPGLLKIFTKQEAYQWLSTIEEAYSVIGHPNSRRVYDMKLNSIFSNESRNLDFINEKIQKTITKQTGPDKGFAYTRISRYKVDKDMEKMILSQDTFDGSFLKRVREYKNIKLPDLSEVTCITIAYLKAIENNDYLNLPALVFVRGYIIQYCHILGLDESKVVPSYISLLKNG